MQLLKSSVGMAGEGGDGRGRRARWQLLRGSGGRSSRLDTSSVKYKHNYHEKESNKIFAKTYYFTFI